MRRITNQIERFQRRNEIPKYQKVKTKNKNSNVVKTEIKKLYDYYKCDYCNDEIRLDLKQYKRSGGIVSLPNSVTNRGNIQLALCNKCLNNVLREFSETMEEIK